MTNVTVRTMTPLTFVPTDIFSVDHLPLRAAAGFPASTALSFGDALRTIPHPSRQHAVSSTRS